LVADGKYRRLNGKYLADAEQLLAGGDYVQASEKFWGAVAQMVKLVAASRRWRHSSHRDLRGTVSRLFRETDDQDLLRLFSVAESLHANFYEDYLQPEDVRVYAEDIRRLIEKLQPFAN
jgi:hypothetical protein